MRARVPYPYAQPYLDRVRDGLRDQALRRLEPDDVAPVHVWVLLEDVLRDSSTRPTQASLLQVEFLRSTTSADVRW